jgi:Leucine-rich repeat (LRR) protein
MSRESGAGRVVFKYGLVYALDSFSWTAPMRRELLKLLADAHATWIVKLTPRDLTLTDLTAFARLQALRQLDFRWTNIRAVRSLAPLAGLHQLQALTLDNSSVADVAPLRRLPLVQLHLGKTQVKDLQQLKGHPTLQHLELGGSPVKDIRALLSCHRLVCVNLWNTKVPVAQVEKLVATIKKRGVKPTSKQEYLTVGYEQLVTHNTVDWY